MREEVARYLHFALSYVHLSDTSLPKADQGQLVLLN